MNSEMLICAEGVSFAYEKDRPVLRDISFALREGETVGLIGENGAGKSTLLRLLVGLLPSYTGELAVCGLPVRKDHLPEIRRRCGYIFQDSDSQLFMNTVGEDVGFAPAAYGCGPEEVRERTERALKLVRIPHLQDQSVYRLSGGEKKLVSIAGVLTMTPELLIMDEPSAALDPKNRRNLIRIVKELPFARLLSSHDLDFVRDTCSRVLLLHEGRIAADGPAEEILRDRELLEAHGLLLPLSLGG